MLDENLVEFFEQSIVENWDSPAFTDFEIRTINYSDVGKTILKLGHFFEKLGLKSGDKISVSGKNSINWVLTYISTISYGAAIVPILADFSADDIQNTVSHSDTKIFFADSSIAEKIDPTAMKNLVAIISLDTFSIFYRNDKSVDQAWEEAEKFYSDKLENLSFSEFSIPNKISNKDTAALIYTSGTTGFSKGVVLPLNSLTTNVKFAQEEFFMPAKATLVSFLPLAHCFGAAFDFLFPFSKGAHINFLGKIPSPQILLDAFQEVKPILVFSVPLVIEKIYKTRIRRMLRKPFIRVIRFIPGLNNILYGIIRKSILKSFGGNVSMIIVGGASFDPVIEKFMKRIKLPISVGYGMTECGPLISFEHSHLHKLGSCGRTIRYLESKIVTELPFTNIGELWVRGENVMDGYYKNDDATKAVLDDEGWLHTGDLGTIDDDGFIFLKGRLKNMILGPSGQNIYPEEIESKLNNMPFVVESIILDDSKHRLHALIYPDKNEARKNGLSEEDLQSKLQENVDTLNLQLPEFSKIHKVNVRKSSFKRTPTQKIIRHLYKDDVH